MNHSTRKADKDCNVCESAVEIVCNAASQCSDMHCITRERGCPLATDSTDEEIAQYYKKQMEDLQSQLDAGLSEQAIKGAALAAFEKYVTADDRETAEAAEIRADTYLKHVDVGWGWLKEESDVI